MFYTFHSFVCLPELSNDEVQEMLTGRPWLKFNREQIGGVTTNRWYVSQSLEQFPDFGDWKHFYTEPNGTGKIEILEIGIGISRASFICPTSKEKLCGNTNGLTLFDRFGYARYWIRSGMRPVAADEVAIFLTPHINSWSEVSFEHWKAFWHVAHKYDKLLRAKRKVDQLRGTRKNSGAFERLSTEIHELISESLREI